jgi:AMIN domain
MHSGFKVGGLRCLLATGCIALCSRASGQSSNPGTATIRSVDVLNRGNNFELEIQSSAPLTPRTQVVTGPDRLVIDFPNAIPGPRLHAIAVNTLHVKGIRAGLFASNPPVARVVIDLNSPQTYQVFPSGKSVIVKITGGEKMTAVSFPAPAIPAVLPSNLPSPPPVPVEPVPALQVEFSNGNLKVWTERATLGEVLHAVARLTGASVSMPPGAEQEPVIAHLGPAPPREVISLLLRGVPYNIVVVGSGLNLSQVTSITLTPRTAATGSMPANYAPAPVVEAPPEPEPEPPPVEQANPPPQDNVPPPPQ